MSDVPIQQWAPRPIGFVRPRTLPSTHADWHPESSPVARYISQLKVLGIKDPTKYLGRTATDHYRAAIAYREYEIESASSVSAEPDKATAIADELSRGSITLAKAKELVDQLPPPSVAAEQAARGRELLATATRTAYRSAVLSVHTMLDKWLALLRPLVQEAVAAKDDERFGALHRFAELLRSPQFGALEMIASDGTGIRETEELWRYSTARPDLFHAWRLEHAEWSHNIASVNAGPVMFAASVIDKGPFPPKLGDLNAEWGLYSASEVMAFTEKILDEQLAAQINAEPPPAPSRRPRAEVSS